MQENQDKESKCILGVGDGNGNLFVEGDYDSIERVQKIIFEVERLRRENKKLMKLLTKSDRDLL